MCRPTAAAKSSSSQAGGNTNMSSSQKPKKPSKPAFEGASFDKDGNCVKHKTVQLAEQVKQDGRLLWQELKMNCPKCVAEHHRSRRVTSLGGAGKIKKGRTVHGMSNPLRDPQKSGRHMDKEFDTPFDEKGRCHHHPNVQMATKKIRGGWKILIKACPKCIEATYDEEASVHSGTSSRASSKFSHKRGGEDEHSVSSRSTKRSVTSRTKPVAQGAKYDKNGCCTRHPLVNIAKKKLLGGWKEYRECPKCLDPNYDDLGDNVSVRSGKSATSFRSTGSRRSTRSKKSMKSNSSRRGGGKTDRYGALPFDEEGYCHAHPSVRLAKKKALGGWKVLHDICPDCAQDASSVAGSRASRRSSRGTGRVFDDSGSDASSYKSGKSTGSRKKKIRVKDMRYQDEHGKEGRYSGDVNEDHQPHGQGKMKYKDGSVFTGVWNDGSQAHGKTSKAKGSSSKSSSGSVREKSSSGSKSKKSSGDWARIENGKANGDSNGNGHSKKSVVRKMKWMDYYGDPGEYTGEVDGSNMPDGKGSMKYDHGLIQEGLWTKGQFVEGSDMNSPSPPPPEGAAKKSSGASSRQLVPKKPSRSAGAGGELRSSRKASSRSHGSSRKLDP